jgi:ABC-type nitrate/sulfonate/bicarbonate transport system substrate-binding protein
MRQSRPRAAKTAAMKKIAAIIADENAIHPEPAPIKIYQFPFIEEGPETHEELVARLTAQLKYYKKHPYVPKKSIIVRFFSYLKRSFK